MKFAHLIAATFIAASLTAPTIARADDPQPPAQEEPKKPEQKAKEPVDYKKLKELLPDTVAGLKRTNASGSKNGMAGMKLSQAEGNYSEDGKEGNATVTINDYGGMPGMLEGMAAWMTMEIDNESDTQISKTLTINGYKAFAEVNLQDKSGHIIAVVGNRFWIEIRIDNGSVTSVDTLKALAESMKLKELEALDR